MWHVWGRKYTVLIGKLMEKDDLKDLRIDGKILK
jgi:hypothetical protein